MGKVAVAGGSSSLGRAMVDALEAAKTHDYIILSRKATGPKTRAANYSDVTSLTSLLESEEVDVVISTLPIDSDESGQAQLNLIEAANRSTCTKRFLPSEFGMVYTEHNIAHVPSYKWRLKAVDALEKTSLEFSLVSIGLFLDYWAAPRIPTHLRAANILIDPENNAAIIPGDGNTPLVLTHSSDAAKFTIALLDLPVWKRRYFIVANRTTLNEAVQLAEEVKGVKFNVKYFSVEQLKKGENDLTPAMKKVLPEEMQEGMKATLALSGIGMAQGATDLNPEDSLTLGFPDIKPLTIREVWEAWK
ncbi:Isoflavone reductase like protein [Fusarium austroafricanum]|uniref:Isoflavone reductase like protein n=1 Tax=Fusarium austroafricanum TaxID=2364996 RepID=A0A8H4KE94_9HYPO|nr:Isoflavone reductase like protein [Fusarium austroafricanum]